MPTLQSTKISDLERINLLADAIVARNANLTSDYNDWLRLAFAIAHSVGEEGRDAFHKISSTYPSYNPIEADVQFSDCLHAVDRGDCSNPCTLGTLFDAARRAGLSIPSSRKSIIVADGTSHEKTSHEKPSSQPSDSLSDVEDDEMLSINLSGYRLPTLLERVVAQSDKPAERDILLLGAVTALSAALPNVCGKYDRKMVFPNLYFMVVGEASSGKSCLSLCRHLVAPIHAKLREKSDRLFELFRQQKHDFATDRTGNVEEPKEPGQLMLFVPANSSATSILEHMADNQDGLLFFETEGDTVANSFKSDYGNYSDTLRKAFHHEPVSYSRRKDKEFREMDNTRLSLVVSGTPSQMAKIFPSVENGLFSRFIFYYLPMTLEWKDVWGDNSSSEPVDAVFRALGQDFFRLYDALVKRDLPVIFDFTPEQKQRCTDYFRQILPHYYSFFGKDILSPVHRLGIIFFRIAMVISALRLYDEQPSFEMAHNALGEHMGDKLYCSDEDFNAVMAIVDCILHHTSRIFQTIPHDSTTDKALSAEDRLHRLASKLPKEFRTADALAIGDTFAFSEAVTKKLLAELVARRIIRRSETRGHYTKP